MGCGDEKLSKYLTQTFTAHCNAMIYQQVTLSGDAEWPKVADAVIEAEALAHEMPPWTPSCCASPIRLHLTNTGEPPLTSRVILRTCSPSRKTREPLGRCGRGALG